MTLKNICHFDISLENFLISDVGVFYEINTGKLQFDYDKIII